MSTNAPQLTPEELGITLELANLISGSATATLSMLMDPNLVIGQPEVIEFDGLEQFVAEGVSSPSVLAVLSFINDYESQVGYLLNLPTAVAMAEAMMGGSSTGQEETITDIQLSAVGESISQMMASAANSISQFLSKPVDISAPQVVQFTPEGMMQLMPEAQSAHIVVIKYRLSGSSVIPQSELLQVVPLPDLRKQLNLVAQPVSVENAFDPVELENPQPSLKDLFEFPNVNQPAPVPEVPVGSAVGSSMGSFEFPVEGYTGGQQQQASGGPMMGFSQEQTGAVRQAPAQPVTVSPVEFASFDHHVPVSGGINKNLELVLDVSLNLTVELGRTELSIKDVLELTRGSVIELDRIAGEPVDLLANGKMIAKGEVVVIEDNFGLRITNIVAPADRLRGL